MRRISSRLTSAHLMSALALFLSMAGGAYAVASNSNPITACVHKKGGGLYKAASCATGDSQLSWNRVGPKGSQGIPGKSGTNGTTIVERTRGSGPSTTSNTPQSSSLTGNTWTQGANELDTIVGQATIQAPAGAACSQELAMTSFPGGATGSLLLDGNSIGVLSVPADGQTHTVAFSLPSPVEFEPGTPAQHTLTAQFEDTCGVGGGAASAHFDVSSVAVDVEGAR